jgi:hypothetical protein
LNVSFSSNQKKIYFCGLTNNLATTPFFEYLATLVAEFDYENMAS